MLLSDVIACAIEELLNQSDGTIELRRGELAARLGCVPSQINYVLTSRFTPERGYVVESRRGGGGYIRIVRAALDTNTYLARVLQVVGDEVDAPTAVSLLRGLYERELLSVRETRTLSALVAMDVTPSVRADMLRRILFEILKSEE